MNKLIVWAVVVILIIGVGIYVVSKYSNTVSSSSTVKSGQQPGSTGSQSASIPSSSQLSSDKAGYKVLTSNDLGTTTSPSDEPQSSSGSDTLPSS